MKRPGAVRTMVAAGGFATRSLAIVAALALCGGLVATPQVRAGASGVDLWFYNDFTDFGLVAVGDSVTRTIAYQNNGQDATLDVFVQSERDQFTAPATIHVAAQSYGEFDVTFAPVRWG